VTAEIAQAVVREARDHAHGRPVHDADIPALVKDAMWEPTYMPLLPQEALAQGDRGE
jgi:hypothetical protein